MKNVMTKKSQRMSAQQLTNAKFVIRFILVLTLCRITSMLYMESVPLSAPHALRCSAPMVPCKDMGSRTIAKGSINVNITLPYDFQTGRRTDLPHVQRARSETGGAKEKRRRRQGGNNWYSMRLLCGEESLASPSNLCDAQR